VTCTVDNNEVTAILYRDGTALGSSSDVQTLDAGSNNYTCNCTATQNYTSAYQSNSMAISKATSIVYLYLDGSRRILP